MSASSRSWKFLLADLWLQKLFQNHYTRHAPVDASGVSTTDAYLGRILSFTDSSEATPLLMVLLALCNNSRVISVKSTIPFTIPQSTCGLLAQWFNYYSDSQDQPGIRQRRGTLSWASALTPVVTRMTGRFLAYMASMRECTS